jgi:F0F1-type ATP synthase membrane subunit b/b'
MIPGLPTGARRVTIIPDPALVLLQAIPFLLTVFALKAIILDPMLAYLDGRHDATVGGRQEVADLEAKAQAHLAAYEKQLDDARTTASGIRAERRQAALAEYAHRIEEARAASARTIEDAVGQIDRARKGARGQLEEQSRSIGAQIASQVLGRETAA